MSIKTHQHLSAIALKREITKVDKDSFFCTDCMRKLNREKDKATGQGICRSCWARKKKAEYRANKYGKECIKCHVISTRFTGVNNICAGCRAEARRHGRSLFKEHLGEKLIMLWKAGYSYEKAIEHIRYVRSGSHF